ncbi:MAG: hypothetical protein LBL07_17590 [Tannerella sp.]|jgi:hypothetical protein|nr:hypothetical protein [Tannerella sp.]
MYYKGFFDQTDGDFIAHANSILDQCTQNKEAWMLDPERLATLTYLTTNANTDPRLQEGPWSDTITEVIE